MLKFLRVAFFGSAALAIFTLNTMARADGPSQEDDLYVDKTLPPSLCKTAHGQRVCDYLVRCQPSQVVDHNGVNKLIYADFGCAQEHSRLWR
jgi:hypothetical protein